MRHCPACKADVASVQTLSEKMAMVDACPKCGLELGEVVKDASTFVVQPPVPAPAAPVAPPTIRAGEVDYVSQLRNRLAFVEGELLRLGAFKQEAALLRKMLAPVKRKPRATRRPLAVVPRRGDTGVAPFAKGAVS